MMTLKDLSDVCMESIKECIEHHVDVSDVDVIMIQDDYCIPVTFSQLRFSNFRTGVLTFDNKD